MTVILDAQRGEALGGFSEPVLARLFANKKPRVAGGAVMGDDMRSLFAIEERVKKPDSLEYVVQSMVAKSDGGIVRMPPGIARRILDEMNFEGQRPRRASRLNKHLYRIKSGAWRDSFPITISRLPNGAMFLVDGQHRLAAIEAAEAPIGIRVLIVNVKSEDEARRLYAGFDEPDSSRNESELLDGVGVVDKLGLKRDTVKAMFRALVLLRNNFEMARSNWDNAEARSVDARLSEISQWVEEAAKYEAVHTCAQPSFRKKLMSAGCMSVALYTFRHQPERAQEFWMGLANNNGLRRYDPRATLIEDFKTRRLNSGSSRQSVQQPSIAWNAWNEGRDLKIIKCIDGAAISIWGTPMSGRRM